MSEPVKSAFLQTIIEDLYIKPAFESLEECRQQGEAALSQAYRRDQNPYPIGTARREWWDAGWIGESEEQSPNPDH